MLQRRTILSVKLHVSLIIIDLLYLEDTLVYGTADPNYPVWPHWSFKYYRFHNHDNNDNADKNTYYGFMSKTTALHVYHAFLYTSLTSTARLTRFNEDVNIWGRIFLSLLEDRLNLRIQVRKNCLERFKQTRLSVEGRKFILLATFSLPSSLSLLKLPNS